VTFRRLLLSPTLRSFGASRLNDTCVLWTGQREEEESQLDPSPAISAGMGLVSAVSLWRSADGELDDAEDEVDDGLVAEEVKEVKKDPDFVSFPPPGICPLGLLHQTVPTWTIMPNYRIFQPTQALQVRMWRVKLIRTSETPPDRPKRSVWPPLPTPHDAERVEELAVPSVTCDCSPKGNSFCVIFRPALIRILEGDCFEVELTGLRGAEEKHSFFHEFRSLRKERQDHCLLAEAGVFREMLDNMQIFEAPKEYKSGELIGKLLKSKTQDLRNFSAGRTRGTAAQLPLLVPPVAPTQLPKLGLVSHLKQDIDLEQPQVTIIVVCKGVAAFTAQLWLIRSSGGRQEVKRATWVLQMRDRFLIRVKLPTASSVYELCFPLATVESPNVLQVHPFKYNIVTTELCHAPLYSFEHPLREKFGFCPMPAAAKIYGITIAAPLNYCIRTGFVYFLVHIDPALVRKEAMGQPSGVVPTSLLFTELCQEESRKGARLDDARDSFSVGASRATPETGGSTSGDDRQEDKRPTLKKAGTKTIDEPLLGAVASFHRCIEEQLEVEQVQDTSGNTHLDLAVAEGGSHHLRYVVRLRQRCEFPELYDGVIFFDDRDAGSRVEMFLRLPRGEASLQAPLKIGEWTVVSGSELLPHGL